MGGGREMRLKKKVTWPVRLAEKVVAVGRGRGVQVSEELWPRLRIWGSTPAVSAQVAGGYGQ